jgi:S1-C subfamily serine protease
MSLRSISLVVLGLWSVSGSVARADNPPLNPAVLKKVKEATVHLEVSLPNGSTAEGSGFFTDEPGVILTNAHVIGMLDSDSRPPVKVVVTVKSGEPDSLSLPAAFLGVDRGSDLALLRVSGKGLPAGLKVVPAKDVSETQEVFIFGFPLGKRLGKNITVSKSSVSSLRKENGVVRQIQVNGGMHPGNSGGPVVNAEGSVVGVAVSVIVGTQLHFAIPGETVQRFLNGRIDTIVAGLGYKVGDQIKMPFKLHVVDPLGRIKQVKMETWIGEAGQRRRPAGTVEPKPLPTDSDLQSVSVPYDRQSYLDVELALPPLDDAKKVYWVRPSYVNGAGSPYWNGAFAPALGAPVDRKDVTVVYRPREGRSQNTELTSEGSFRIASQGEEKSLALNSKSTVVEKTAPKTGGVTPVHLEYRGFTMSILEDKKPLPADAELKRHINNIRFMAADYEVDANGDVTRAKADSSKVPRASRGALEQLGEQVVQAVELVAVPLPDGTLKPLQSWKVQRNVMLGIPGLAVPAVAEIKYVYLGTRMLRDREIAFLDIKGSLKGLRGAGLNIGGTVGGASQVALDTGEVLASSMDFKADVDLETRSGKAKLFGTLLVRVRRDIPAAAAPAKAASPQPAAKK